MVQTNHKKYQIIKNNYRVTIYDSNNKEKDKYIGTIPIKTSLTPQEIMKILLKRMAVSYESNNQIRILVQSGRKFPQKVFIKRLINYYAVDNNEKALKHAEKILADNKEIAITSYVYRFIVNNYKGEKYDRKMFFFNAQKPDLKKIYETAKKDFYKIQKEALENRILFDSEKLIKTSHYITILEHSTGRSKTFKAFMPNFTSAELIEMLKTGGYLKWLRKKRKEQQQSSQ